MATSSTLFSVYVLFGQQQLQLVMRLGLAVVQQPSHGGCSYRAASYLVFLKCSATQGTAASHLVHRHAPNPFPNLQVPIAMVTFVDKERVWLKSVQGLAGLKEVDRRYSVCAWCVAVSRAQCTRKLFPFVHCYAATCRKARNAQLTAAVVLHCV